MPASTANQQFPLDYDNFNQNSINSTVINSTENGELVIQDMRFVVSPFHISGTNIWASFNFPVYGKTHFYLTDLHHFTLYNIHVQACRKGNDRDDKGACSDIAISTARTLKRGRKTHLLENLEKCNVILFPVGADTITSVQITNKSLGMVSLTWDEPKEPNGLILTYQIEYKRKDIDNVSV